MPIYEYRCKTCGKTYEELIMGDRDKKVPCPSCGSGETEKLISVIGGITLRGAAPGTPCGPACANASACAASGGGCCPHAM